MHRFTALLVLTLSACSETVTAPPNALGGTLQLLTYNGGALPQQIDPAFGACGAQLVAGSVADGEPGRVTFSQTTRDPCHSSIPLTIVARAGRIAMSGSTVTITLDGDPGFGYPEQVYTGTLTGSTLTLSSTVVYSTRQLVQSFAFGR